MPVKIYRNSTMFKSRVSIHQITNGLLIISVIGLLLSSSLRLSVASTLQSWMLQTGLVDAEATANTSLGFVDRDLPLETLNGIPLDTTLLTGKPIFLHIWASWCPPCVAEMPDIQQLVNAVPAEEVAFVLLTVDKDPSKAQQFLTDRNYIGLPVYRATVSLAELPYSVIPTTYIIAPSGEVVYKHEGLAQYNHEKFREMLRRMK